MNMNQIVFHVILIIMGIIFLGIGMRIKWQSELLRPVFYMIGVVFLLLGLFLPFLLFG